jgi:hypothetical protein
MTFRVLIFLVAIAVATLGRSAAVSAGPWQAFASGKPGSTETKPTEAKRTETKSASLPPPIVFFLARGEPNACGPGCQEWIAADGTIDAGADGRLRAFLKRLGARKLPIFFHSPGGSIAAGLGIGRLMRERGLTAGVGWTVPQGCDPRQAREEACDKLKRSGRDLPAQLDTTRTMCNSSCVYALVGAAVREIGAGIQLGIHSSSISFSLKRTDGAGHVTRVPAKVPPAMMRTAMQAGYDRVAAYLREMGISTGLLAAAREVGNDRLRFLSRGELVAFGIDRRDFVEGAWWFVDQPTGASAVKVIEARDPGAGLFRKMVLRLACRNAGAIRFQFVRELGADKATLSIPLRVRASGKDFPLTPGVAVAQTDDKPAVEVRTADLPLSVLTDAAFIVETAESAAAAPAPTAPRFAMLAAPTSGPSLGALVRRCGNDLAILDRGAAEGRAASLPSQIREPTGGANGGTETRPHGTFSPASAGAESPNPQPQTP